jgi:hypothetical protein
MLFSQARDGQICLWECTLNSTLVVSISAMETFSHTFFQMSLINSDTLGTTLLLAPCPEPSNIQIWSVPNRAISLRLSPPSDLTLGMCMCSRGFLSFLPKPMSTELIPPSLDTLREEALSGSGCLDWNVVGLFVVAGYESGTLLVFNAATGIVTCTLQLCSEAVICVDLCPSTFAATLVPRSEKEEKVDKELHTGVMNSNTSPAAPQMPLCGARFRGMAGAATEQLFEFAITITGKSMHVAHSLSF